MTMTEPEALKLIAEALGGKNIILRPGMTRDEIPTWDSVGAIMLMAELDEKFGISMEEKDLEALNGINDILEVLKKNGKLEE